MKKVLKKLKVKVITGEASISIGSTIGLGLLQAMVDDIHDQMIKEFEKNLSETNAKAAELRTLINHTTLLREYANRRLNDIDLKIKEVEAAQIETCGTK